MRTTRAQLEAAYRKIRQPQLSYMKEKNRKDAPKVVVKEADATVIVSTLEVDPPTSL